MKVFVVSSRSFCYQGDRYVCCVFADEHEAKKFCLTNNAQGLDTYDYDEFEVK